MMENSKIEWTTHTFNPWIGCTKVSPGCQHCYAESLMGIRYGRVKWGPQGTRMRTSDANWRKPLIWNRNAREAGRRDRVFCASLADAFEDRPGLEEWRVSLLYMILSTPHLDWLLLTKRPENVLGMVPGHWKTQVAGEWPGNLWIGASVENQEMADKRISQLLGIPAPVRFLSCEPLIGPVDLTWYMAPQFAADDPRHYPWRNGVEWVIAGGESGPHARPMHPDWARSLRDQCQAAGVPFFFKQWGEWAPVHELRARDTPRAIWHNFDPDVSVCRVGKSISGRLLDGRTWDEAPDPVRISGE